jgi:predicted small lipoprotein YifL
MGASPERNYQQANQLNKDACHSHNLTHRRICMRITLYPVTLALLSALGIASCEQEGPMEEAGETIDQATEQTMNKAEKAAEQAGDKVEKATNRVEGATSH